MKPSPVTEKQREAYQERADIVAAKLFETIHAEGQVTAMPGGEVEVRFLGQRIEIDPYTHQVGIQYRCLVCREHHTYPVRSKTDIAKIRFQKSSTPYIMRDVCTKPKSLDI